MIDTLQAPADLGTARARLHDLARPGADRGPLVRLGRPGSGSGRADGPGGGDWPDLPAGTGAVVADLVLWRAGRANLRTLSAALDRDQVLVFLEPTAEVGWRRLVQRLGRGLWRRLAGHDFECDVPAELRAAGLEVTELDRFGIGRLGVRSYALGRAEHIRA